MTRKITRALARIRLGLQDRLYLGNMSAKRDWGHAKDYVEMQWLMLQQDQPQDFDIATGRQYSVRQFVETAAAHIDMRIEWEGEGLKEKGVDAKTGKVIVEVDPRNFRPAEVETLLGDARKAHAQLGWEPKITFEEMVQEMMQTDLELAKCDDLVEREGYKAFRYFE